jgi:hypothetical protein
VTTWVRFDSARTADSLPPLAGPAGCALWKFGPDTAPGSRASRAGSTVWCGIAGFTHRDGAQAAFERPMGYVPALAESCEAFHALLLPVAHRGECNYLDPAQPGPLFAASAEDPRGPLLVMTTAGFDLRAKSDFARLIDFRRRVHAMRDVIAQAEGSLAHQVFAPAGEGTDAATMSLWRDDDAMAGFAYQPGAHRSELDRQIRLRTVDRSSFTRFRIVARQGRWNDSDPLDGRSRAPSPL